LRGETPQTEAPARNEATTKAKASPQTHHCFKDSKLMADKTHKGCTAAAGKWQKDVGPAAKADPATKQ